MNVERKKKYDMLIFSYYLREDDQYGARQYNGTITHETRVIYFKQALERAPNTCSGAHINITADTADSIETAIAFLQILKRKLT